MTDLASAPFYPDHSAQSLPSVEHWQPQASLNQKIEAGRKLRKSVPRRLLASLTPRSRDPLGILDEQNTHRLQNLVPVRTERMSQSPFTFYRGSAAIMAADFADEPHTGLMVPSCGDAHVSNFGFYASPLRTLVFDLNDFDEAAWGPWEWDLKRLLASIVIAAQATGRTDACSRASVMQAVKAYASTMRSVAALSPLERYYMRLDADSGIDNLPRSAQQVLRRAIRHAQKRTGDRAVRKLTYADPDTGQLRFRHEPPTMTPLESATTKKVRQLMRRYLETASSDITQLLRNYSFADTVRRVVGVGSVGTRCSLSLLQDGDGHALILQSKEANRSVLEQYGGITQPRILSEAISRHGEGARVVELQRMLQAVSDPFLGYFQNEDADLYVRQFHDMKGGIEVEAIDDESFRIYASACGITLARAHSRSPLAAIISGYLGSGSKLGALLFDWAVNYAALSQSDFEAFTAARA